MLLELSIKDFAIIDSLTVNFSTGLNIFTGETGAGKSIIIDALALILGDRASNETIRSEREEARIEAMFDITGSAPVSDVLTEAGIESADTLIIRRVIQRAGRNKIYINGSLATLVTLSEVGRHLIDIYGQSEHQSLTRPEEHVEMLDSFARLGGLRDNMAEAYREYAALKKELDATRQRAATASAEKDLLSFQLGEIDDAGLRPGEDLELKRDAERLKNAGKIKSAAEAAESELYSSESSVVERLGAQVRAIKEAAVFDERLVKVIEPLETSLYQIEDAAAFLRSYGDEIEADPDALDAIGARLDLIGRLKKKYGDGIEEILARRAAIEEELSGISNSEQRIAELEKQTEAAGEKAALVANRLTELRRKAAAELKACIERELEGLGMKGSIFEAIVESEATPDGSVRFGEKGADRVSFFISPNPGEEIKPLAMIASGGELSRIMLAVKRASAAGRVPILVFDEIDSGIGGATSQAVGRKLKEVSATHQVLCITHLPQIAAYADSHYSVSKGQTGEGRTVTTIRRLSEEGSVEEISSMLGGVNVTDTTRSHARELLAAARSTSQGGDMHSGGDEAGA